MGPLVFAVARRRPPDARQGYPWGQLGVGPHPPAPLAVPLALRAGPPPWEASFAVAFLQWANQHRWLPGQGHVTYVELALDFEAHANGPSQPPATTGCGGVTLLLRTKGQVLKMALDALQPHEQVGGLPKELWVAKSLLPLGASGVWGGRRACCSRALPSGCFKCTAGSCGRGAWLGQERDSRICSYYITSHRRGRGRSHCGPFSACRAGRCSATGKGPAKEARA